MACPARNDLLGKILGVLVFLIGIGVILYVLKLAFGMLHDPAMGIVLPTDTKNNPNLAVIGVSFLRLLMRIVVLFLCCIGGSLIANKGVHLYFCSHKPPEHNA
jgi:hypothetical protein